MTYKLNLLQLLGIITLKDIYWWQLKLFLFSPLSLGEDDDPIRLVQPPTDHSINAASWPQAGFIADVEAKPQGGTQLATLIWWQKYGHVFFRVNGKCQ